MAKKMNNIKINKFHTFLLKYFPKIAFRYFAKKMDINDRLLTQANDVFSNIKKVDFEPYMSGSRGFIIILDRKLALYFNQDGDHFAYDGFEMGEYDKGDVTIFDKIKPKIKNKNQSKEFDLEIDELENSWE